MHVMHAETGWLEVICGPMFSGKSEELIRRLRRAKIAGQAVQVFKPAIDDRYDAQRIVSHSKHSLDAQPVAEAKELARAVHPDTRVVGIDEAQFFDQNLVSICESLANGGVRVIVAGLDQDFRGRPFEPVPTLAALAEYVTKSLAICVRCGAPAGRTQRLGASADRVEVGAAERYEARCRQCHAPRSVAVTGELFGDAD